MEFSKAENFRVPFPSSLPRQSKKTDGTFNTFVISKTSVASSWISTLLTRDEPCRLTSKIRRTLPRVKRCTCLEILRWYHVEKSPIGPPEFARFFKRFKNDGCFAEASLETALEIKIKVRWSAIHLVLQWLVLDSGRHQICVTIGDSKVREDSATNCNAWRILCAFYYQMQ